MTGLPFVQQLSKRANGEVVHVEQRYAGCATPQRGLGPSVY